VLRLRQGWQLGLEIEIVIAIALLLVLKPPVWQELLLSTMLGPRFPRQSSFVFVDLVSLIFRHVPSITFVTHTIHTQILLRRKS